MRRRQGGLWLLLRRERLSMGAVEDWLRSAATLSVSAKMRVGSVRGHKRLRLGRHGCEHALLVESDAIGAAAVLGGLKSRASNLCLVASVS